MGLLSWAFQQKYYTEKELLKAYLSHTEAWYNELTNPLKGFIYEMSSNGKVLDPKMHAEIAREMYYREIESNKGNDLKNTMEQMDSMGIPLFSHRNKLQKRTQEYLKSGYFLKEYIELFSNWDELPEHLKWTYRKNALDSWKNFKESKERLVTEINRQIRRLG